ncbi:MAG: exodeoxyribonuclease VII large subunit [bacterium]|nr:exodeoxyribonuclease VII large subunit [bacterium]
MRTLPPDVTVRTVAEFTNGLATWFDRQPAFKNAAISGEISGMKTISGGHRTFTLKDRGGVLSCIVWQSTLARLPELRDGMAVVALGTVKLYRERSGYQLVVDDVFPAGGVGALFAQVEALRERFRAEGLFAQERKRAIPRFVHHVALVSSEGSDASKDFLQTIHTKAPFVRVSFVKTRVQGGGAEIEIAEAIDEAVCRNPDVIVVTRGGGSFEDRFAFNLEPVVRAIARSGVPVITAIGHQEDHHLADDVADAIFGTPSKAAEAIAAPWVAAADRVAVAQRDLQRAMRDLLGTRSQTVEARTLALDATLQSRLASASRRFHEFERRVNAQNPQARIAQRQQRLAGMRARLDTLPTRLLQGWSARIEPLGARLDALIVRRRESALHALQYAGARLDAVDPTRPLERGYAIVERDGVVLRSASEVRPGDRISARLGHGTLDARVEGVRDE